MTGILQQLPDIALLQSTGADASSDLTTLLDTLQGLASGDERSPLSTITRSMADLDDLLSIDVGGLTEQLPTTLRIIEQAIPPDTMAYVNSISEAYATATDFLENSAVVEQVKAGGDLQSVALAVVEDALDQFETRLDDLVQQLVPADQLNQATAMFTALEQFREDFPAHEAELLPFLSQTLVGLAPDWLDAPLERVEDVYGQFQSVDLDTLSQRFQTEQAAIATTITQLTTVVNDLTPTDISVYETVEAQLDVLEPVLDSLLDASLNAYVELEQGLTQVDGQAALNTYTTVLNALTFPPIPSIDDVVDQMVAVLEDLLSQLQAAVGPEDVAERINALTQHMKMTMQQSGLGQIRQTLQGFLGQIQDSIAACRF